MGHEVILIDSKNAAYRHGWTRAGLRNKEGKPTGAIFGVLSCLIRISKAYPNAKFVFCWDGKETWKSWRHRFCDTYKANRKKPGDKDVPSEVKDILKQLPAIKKSLSILGFQQFEVDRLEGDDLIGVVATALSKRKDVNKVLIYSMDKDFYQLIDTKIKVLRDLNKSDKCKAYDAKDVQEDFGVAASQWIRYRALIGDPSDGIKPPIRGIGKVRALKLLAEGLDPSNKKPHSKIEKQYKAHWHNVHTNYKLSKIVTKATSRVLPQVSRESLDEVLDTLHAAMKQHKKVDDATARKFVQFCADYELNWILENRYVLYRLGR